MRISLIRHGQADGAEGRVVGHLDLPLSPEGAAQITALAETWQGPRPQSLVTSDLRRATDSAAILAERMQLDPQPEPRLRELHFGAWEGLAWEEVHHRQPELLAAWGDQWSRVSPPDGESFGALCHRAGAWLRELPHQGNVVAVTHGGTIRALLAEAVGVTPQSLFEYHLGLGRVTVLERQGQSWRLVCLDEPHFPPDASPSAPLHGF